MSNLGIHEECSSCGKPRWAHRREKLCGEEVAISTIEADLQDALMFLRIVLTRNDVTSLNCLKPKIADWLKRKGYQGSIISRGQT